MEEKDTATKHQIKLITNRMAMKDKLFRKIKNNLINSKSFLNFLQIITNLTSIVTSIFLVYTTIKVNDSIVKFNKFSANTNKMSLESNILQNEINKMQNDFVNKQTNLSIYEFYEKRINNIKDILNDMQMSFLETKNNFFS